jgi:hypothetical protein
MLHRVKLSVISSELAARIGRQWISRTAYLYRKLAVSLDRRGYLWV